MAIIQSGVSLPTLWEIDAGSNAGRVTLYDSNGNELAGVGVLESLNNILDSLNENVTLNLSGQACTSVQMFATTGTLTVTFEANIDGTNWFTVTANSLYSGMTSASSVDGVWFIDTSGYKQVRVIVTSYTSGNTIVSMIADPEQRDIFSSITVLGTDQDNTPNSLFKIPVISAVASASDPSWTDGYMVPLSVTDSGYLRVTGTLTETNASIGLVAHAPPSSATYMGALATTLVESGLTSGDMYPLSLTTNGLLRVDGSNVTQPVSGIGVDNTTNSISKLPVLAARANTSSPFWTDGYMVPLSTDTSGNLRVTGSMTVDKSGTSTITSVVGATSSTSILASNSNRILATVFNATNKTMYVALASSASTSAYTLKVPVNSYYELPVSYTGAISAVWDMGVSGNAMITEMTP